MQLIFWLFAPQQQLPMKMKLIIMFVTLRFLCVRPFLPSFFEPQLSHSFRSYFRFRFCVRFWEFQSCVWARSGLRWRRLWQIGGLLVYDLIMAIRSASLLAIFFAAFFAFWVNSLPHGWICRGRSVRLVAPLSPSSENGGWLVGRCGSWCDRRALPSETNTQVPRCLAGRESPPVPREEMYCVSCVEGLFFMEVFWGWTVENWDSRPNWVADKRLVFFVLLSQDDLTF